MLWHLISQTRRILSNQFKCKSFTQTTVINPINGIKTLNFSPKSSSAPVVIIFTAADVNNDDDRDGNNASLHLHGVQ